MLKIEAARAGLLFGRRLFSWHVLGARSESVAYSPLPLAAD